MVDVIDLTDDDDGVIDLTGDDAGGQAREDCGGDARMGTTECTGAAATHTATTTAEASSLATPRARGVHGREDDGVAGEEEAPTEALPAKRHKLSTAAPLNRDGAHTDAHHTAAAPLPPRPGPATTPHHHSPSLSSLSADPLHSRLGRDSLTPMLPAPPAAAASRPLVPSAPLPALNNNSATETTGGVASTPAAADAAATADTADPSTTATVVPVAALEATAATETTGGVASTPAAADAAATADPSTTVTVVPVAALEATAATEATGVAAVAAPINSGGAKASAVERQKEPSSSGQRQEVHNRSKARKSCCSGNSRPNSMPVRTEPVPFIPSAPTEEQVRQLEYYRALDDGTCYQVGHTSSCTCPVCTQNRRRAHRGAKGMKPDGSGGDNMDLQPRSADESDEELVILGNTTSAESERGPPLGASSIGDLEHEMSSEDEDDDEDEDAGALLLPYGYGSGGTSKTKKYYTLSDEEKNSERHKARQDILYIDIQVQTSQEQAPPVQVTPLFDDLKDYVGYDTMPVVITQRQLRDFVTIMPFDRVGKGESWRKNPSYLSTELMNIRAMCATFTDVADTLLPLFERVAELLVHNSNADVTWSLIGAHLRVQANDTHHLKPHSDKPGPAMRLLFRSPFDPGASTMLDIHRIGTDEDCNVELPANTVVALAPKLLGMTSNPLFTHAAPRADTPFASFVFTLHALVAPGREDQVQTAKAFMLAPHGEEQMIHWPSMTIRASCSSVAKHFPPQFSIPITNTQTVNLLAKVGEHARPHGSDAAGGKVTIVSTQRSNISQKAAMLGTVTWGFRKKLVRYLDVGWTDVQLLEKDIFTKPRLEATRRGLEANLMFHRNTKKSVVGKPRGQAWLASAYQELAIRLNRPLTEEETTEVEPQMVDVVYSVYLSQRELERVAAKGKGPTTEVPWGHAAQEADTDSGMSGAGGSSSALQPTADDQPVGGASTKMRKPLLTCKQLFERLSVQPAQPQA